MMNSIKTKTKKLLELKYHYITNYWLRREWRLYRSVWALFSRAAARSISFDVLFDMG